MVKYAMHIFTYFYIFLHIFTYFYIFLTENIKFFKTNFEENDGHLQAIQGGLKKSPPISNQKRILK